MLPVAGIVAGIAPVYPKTGDMKVFTDRACRGINSHCPVKVTMFTGAIDTDRVNFAERSLA